MSKTQKVLNAATLCTKLHKDDARTSLECQLNTEGKRKTEAAYYCQTLLEFKSINANST